MKHSVQIEGVGNVAFPDSMSDAEVSEVAGRLYDDTTSTGAASKAGVTGQVAKLADQDTSRWRHIQTSD